MRECIVFCCELGRPLADASFGLADVAACGEGSQPSDPVADALFDKIDLSETEDELRKVKDEIKAATLPDRITKTVIGAYNAKLRKIKGGAK